MTKSWIKSRRNVFDIYERTRTKEWSPWNKGKKIKKIKL